MNTGNHTLSYVFDNNDVDQFIVPEIQRDYVWRQNDVIDLLNYLQEGYRGSIGDTPYLGFIYAYTIKEYPHRYFLIDGQQRLTTIFLLLILCYQKLGQRIPDYLFDEGKIKIDYKVRQTTHDFISDLLQFYVDNSDVFDFKIEDQVWYHTEYKNDRTINNVVNNISTIKEWLSDFTPNELPLFLNYVEQNVTISYYNIAECRQGEDLYIYMNSRGRHLEPNETLKAKFLSTTNEKEHWGKVWEDWQDFFWRNRGARLDADAGFNDFLRMIQIINMAKSDRSFSEISSFASGKSEQPPTYALLPQSLLELNAYFEAFKWLVENPVISEFFERYESQNYIAHATQLRLIFLFRVLPLLAFTSITGCRDEESVKRFQRFLYNASRKESIKKDISSHLPSTIKLMIEYGLSKRQGYDVCDLIQYQVGRSVLIDKEEIWKLKIYKSPPSNSTRTEIERLFWLAEDNPIFDGEISFLLTPYYKVATNDFDLVNYCKTWDAFHLLFSTAQRNYYRVTVALLYYGFTWFRDTPNYYVNYCCQAWSELVRNANGKFLMQLLEDMHLQPIEYLDTIIKRKAKQFFIANQYSSKQVLVAINDLFTRIQVLAAIDYYGDRKLFADYENWSRGYIADDIRINYNDRPFFVNYADLFNVYRYIDNASISTRIIPMLSSVLFDDVRLDKIIGAINSFEEEDI